MFMILLFKILHIILFILHYTLLKHYLCDLRDMMEREESKGKRERSEVRKKNVKLLIVQKV